MYFKIEYDQNTRTGIILFEDFEKAIKLLESGDDIDYRDSDEQYMSFIDSMSKIFDSDTVWFKRFEENEVELQTIGPMTFELKGITEVNEDVTYLARYFDKPEFRKYLGSCNWDDDIHAIPTANIVHSLKEKTVSLKFLWELL